MGNIKKKKRHFDTPRKRWDKERIEKESEIKKTFGLKNKRELWKMETLLRKKKKQARALLALELEQRLKREKELINSLAKYGLLDEKAGIDNILSLPTESLLERRLQTIVWRQGLAGTITQARQFVVHGHIAINGKKVSIPSYLVTKTEEEKIAYYGKPMAVQEKKKKEIKKIEDKRKIAKDFEEAKPKEEAQAEGTSEAPQEKIPEEPQAETLKTGTEEKEGKEEKQLEETKESKKKIEKHLKTKKTETKEKKGEAE